MKTIYKSLMTIAFAGLCLASCDKELKEDTTMEVGVVTDSNVSSVSYTHLTLPTN